MMPLKYSILTLTFLIVYGFLMPDLHAQETLNTTGGSNSGSNGSVSYSVGQAFYTFTTGVTGSVAEGVQQAYEISIITETLISKEISLSIKAFPNPSSDYLHILVENEHESMLSCKLYDINGKLLDQITVESGKAQLSMKNYQSSIYFIHVTQGGNVIQTFKILKK